MALALVGWLAVGCGTSAGVGVGADIAGADGASPSDATQDGGGDGSLADSGGSLPDGSPFDGSALDGSLPDGSPFDGSALDGSLPDGSPLDGGDPPLPDAGDALSDTHGEDGSAPVDVPTGEDTPTPDDTASDADAPPPCEGGAELVVSGFLPVDVHTVQVNGVVTLLGGAVPQAKAGRGHLRFEGPDGWVRLPLAAAGPASFQGALFAGTYAVFYEPPPACDPDDAALPCQRARLLAPTPFTTSGWLDLDAHVVDITGTVTRNGAKLPQSTTPRGQIQLAGVHAEQIGLPIADVGPASFGGTVFADTYAVRYESLACGDDAALPCYGYPVFEALPLTADGALDVDLPVVTVQGAVKKNGAQLGQAAGGRGRMELRAWGEAVSYPLTKTGVAFWSGEVFAGTHALWYVPEAACAEGAPLPCQEFRAKSAVSLLVSGSVDVDLPVVALSGTLTLDGVTPAGAPSGRGSVVLSGDPIGERVLPLKATGPATFGGDVFAATCDVRYEPPPACDPDEAPLPCMTHRQLAAVKIAAAGALDLDVHAVHVSGLLTLDGGPMPKPAAGRGTLRFSDPAGALDVPLDAPGAATYEAWLFEGTYDVDWLNPAGCKPDEAIPCLRRRLFTGLPLVVDGSLDANLPTVHIDGALTRDGQSLATISGSRGTLRFVAAGGGEALWPLKPTGPATFAGLLFPASYDVWFDAPSDCKPDTAALPCGAARLVDCE